MTEELPLLEFLIYEVNKEYFSIKEQAIFHRLLRTKGFNFTRNNRIGLLF